MKTFAYPLMALVSGLAGSFLILLTAMALQATADPQIDTVPRLIPYSGTLEFNSEGVTLLGEDAIFLRFDIMDENNESELVVVYSQTVQTEVFGGEFTAFLGETDDTGLIDIEDIVANADALFLQVTVLGNTTAEDAFGYHSPNDPSSTADDDVVLSNPQRLLMSPFSLWATSATNFDASEGVTVGTRLEVVDGVGNGVTLENGQLDASGDVTLGNGPSNVALGLTEGSHFKLDDLSALTVEPGQNVVQLNPNGDFSSGVVNHGSARATGATTITGDNALVDLQGTTNLLSLGAGSSGTHGFRFGDLDNTSIQVGLDTATDLFVIEKTDGTDLLTTHRSSGASIIHDNIQVNGTLGMTSISADNVNFGTPSNTITVNGDLKISSNTYMSDTDPFDTNDNPITYDWPTNNGDSTNHDGTNAGSGNFWTPESLSYATALNSGGISTGLERYTRGFCVLTRIRLSEMSSDVDVSGCQVYLSNSFWRLQAISKGSGAYCEARCFTWETSHQ